VFTARLKLEWPGSGTFFKNTGTFTGVGKAVPLQAWSGPEGSRKVHRFHDNGTGWW